MHRQLVRFKLRIACFHQLSFACIDASPTRKVFHQLSFACIDASPTRKVQTARRLFSPTIVSYRRFSSDRTKKISHSGYFILVALVGLEPTLLAELDFESSASTNSATGPKHKLRVYFAAVFLASTFLTRRALRVALCTGFFAGFSALPTFFSIAFFIAAMSSVRRDTGFDIT